MGIVIPIEQVPGRIEVFERNFLERAEELRRSDATIVLVSDSPRDVDLSRVLDEMVGRLTGSIRIELLRNERKLGSIRSVNRGLAWCLERGADALLLDANGILADRCVSELQRVSLADPMIGMVCPRTNRGSICSLPPHQAEKRLSYGESCAAFEQIHAHLPEWHFAPTGIGACMYIRNLILKEFGVLDTAYNPGTYEDADLCCRVNRCGFRVAIANHAYCFFEEAASLSGDIAYDARPHDQEILESRYPEYHGALATYREGPECCFERTLAVLAQRPSATARLLIDFSHFQTEFNGTFEYGKRIARALIDLDEPRFEVSLMCGEEVARYHNLYRDFSDVRIVSPSTDEVFDIALKPAQPFTLEDVARLCRRALFNFYVMLDPIALDCAYIRPRTLHSLWRLVSRYSDGLIFISQFSFDQFTRRLRPSPHTATIAALCSTDVREYGPVHGESRGPGLEVAEPPFILVVGNHYRHKFIEPTVEILLKNCGVFRLVVLGSCSTTDPRVTVVSSGQLDEGAIDRLYQTAEIIVFPSMYEGFGFPVLHGLSRGKMVLARDSSLNREILGRWNGGGELVLFRDTEDLGRVMSDRFSRCNPGHADERLSVCRGDSESRCGWSEAAGAIATMLTRSRMTTPVSPLAWDRMEAVLGIVDESSARSQEVERSLRREHADEIAQQQRRFEEVISSPSFKIGKMVTTFLGKIPSIRPAYSFFRASRMRPDSM